MRQQVPPCGSRRAVCPVATLALLRSGSPPDAAFQCCSRPERNSRETAGRLTLGGANASVLRRSRMSRRVPLVAGWERCRVVQRGRDDDGLRSASGAETLKFAGEACWSFESYVSTGSSNRCGVRRTTAMGSSRSLPRHGAAPSGCLSGGRVSPRTWRSGRGRRAWWRIRRA
jgi:hypothetical protein